jgi:hypothetical protein
VHGQGEQVRVPEALADLGGGGRHGVGGLVLAAGLVAQHRRQQQVALLDAVAPLPFEQPLGPAKPARGPPPARRGRRG